MSALSPAVHAEALVAGTLCLMSCHARSPARHHAERIADNLALLADNPAVSPELRSLCRRLSGRWDAIALDAPAANASEAFPRAPVH